MNEQQLVALIEHDLTGAQTKHNQQVDQVRSWIKQYNGEPYGNEDKNRSQMVWKLIKKQGESLISNLSKQFLGSHQIVELDPITARDTFKAKIYSGLINHFWSKEFNSNKFIKSICRLDVKEGTAFVRVGWEQNIEYDKQIVDDIPEEVIEQIQNTGAKVRQLENGTFQITKKNIITNRPTAKVVRLEDIYLDPTADTFEDLKFLIHKYTSDLSTMKKQPHLYDEAAIKRLEKVIDENDDTPTDAMIEQHQYNPTSFEFMDKTRKQITLYEYWGEYDIDDTGITKPCVAVMARYGDKRTIVRMEENKFPFKSIPFICIPLIEDEFNIYGLGLTDMIEDEQMFSTGIIRGVQDNMSMSNKNTKFVKKNALDPQNYDRLIAGEPVVEVNTHENINTAIMDGNFNQLPQSVYNMLSIIDQQAESLTGISKMMQGIPGTEMKAASSNFSAVMSQSQIRLLDMTTSITTGLRHMFGMWAQMSIEYLDDNEIQDITGVFIPEVKVKETKKLVTQYGIDQLPPETQSKAMQIIIQEINDQFDMGDFKYDVKMKVGTDGLKDIKINQINMLMQQSMNLVQAQVVPPGVLGMLFSDMATAMDRPDIAKIVEEYQPQPDPMQQAMGEAELKEKEANVNKDNALAENAMARTRNVDGKTMKEADNNPLDKAKKATDISATQNKMDTDSMNAMANMQKALTADSKPAQNRERKSS